MQLDKQLHHLYLSPANRDYIDQCVICKIRSVLGDHKLDSATVFEAAFAISYDHSFPGSAFQRDNPFCVENQLVFVLKALGIYADDRFEFDRTGRTDANVACLDQVVILKISSDSFSQIKQLMNKVLMPRMCIKSIQHKQFSPRFDCVFRTYQFLLGVLSDERVKILNKKAKCVVGTHDFRNLSYENKEVVRTVNHIHVFNTMLYIGRKITVMEICGKAFAYHQVRCIASALLEGNITEVLQKKEKIKKLVPGEGLVLVKAKWANNEQEWESDNTGEEFKRFVKEQTMQFAGFAQENTEWNTKQSIKTIKK
ncbi:TRNA_pseudouridine synthase [Hexamita inflata]|uniref:tRNA pseudouridine synthase n=1 Tax=Hexamita inflata TaxID=28002 RepID=A0AA86P0Q0_9EUKA|nr:TRNA pseudouridine synthase [Hexamita inflata]